MTRYIDPRTKRRRRSNRKDIRRILLIIIVLATFGMVAYTTCSKLNHDKEASNLAKNVELAKLANVIAPEATDGQLLHYPGFDILFSPGDHQPYYAAWIVTRDNVENAKYERSKFKADPNVEGSATPDDYRNSGYDRGHIVPAGDMKHSAEGMDACFYMTNISPQNTKLNTKAWKNLEELTRKWAVRDSVLIVVAGPILTDRLSKTIGRTGVTVPQRYFKVLLAPYANPPRAIGFVMENGDVQGGVQTATMTVDQVELITGYDFYSALPDELENDIESKSRFSEWTIKK